MASFFAEFVILWWVGGKGVYGWMRAHTISKYTFTFTQQLFSYLTLFLQQYSLPNLGVNLLSIYKQKMDYQS